jgi:RNA polymerase sigma factor (sigma-70 family)
VTSEDRGLWHAFRKGDDNAFEALLRTYYKSLLEYGFQFIKDRDVIQDLVHDLFINLWERRTFLNPEINNVKLYLFISLKNQIFKYLKKNAHHEFLPEDWQDQEPASDHLIENSLIEQEVLLENQSRLQLALGRLSKRQREILHLKFYETLTHEQIAEVMAISPPAVRNLLSQSLKMLREQWDFLIPLFYLLLN